MTRYTMHSGNEFDGDSCYQVKFAGLFLDRMDKFGQWEDGCFHYNRTCASELQEVIAMAKQALKEEHP